MKTTSKNIISTYLESWEIQPKLLYRGKFVSIRRCIPIRVNDSDRQHEITDTPQKSVYIPYSCLQLFVHMYLLPDSSSISISVFNPVESTGIRSHSAGFHWTPLDSNRNRGGTVKYWRLMERGWRRLMERCWTSSPFIVASSWHINVVAHRCRLIVASPGRVVVVPCHCRWLIVVPSCISTRWVGGRWDGGTYLASTTTNNKCHSSFWLPRRCQRCGTCIPC